MMEKHFMLDIEATGIDWTKEELLSIGLLEVDWDGEYWVPRKAREWLQHSTAQPQSDFAKAHMAALYERCRNAAHIPVERLRWEILDFFRSCGTKGVEDTYLMGWNASNFDIPFLCHDRVLEASRYEPGPDGKDRQVGDFHYRVYEIGGAVSLVQNQLRTIDRAEVIKRAREMAPPMFIPEGKQHDALHDCYTQLKLLNGLIALSRSGRA